MLNKKIIIFILFLIALGVRLIALKQNYIIAPDAILYIKMAKLFFAGQFHSEIIRNYSYYAFYPFLIVPFYKVFGDWVYAGQWVSTLCGALTVIPLYLLARRIFDEKIAFWGAIFYAICPNLIRYSAEVLRDIPFVFFYTSALWLGYRGIKDEKLVFVGLSALFIALSASLRIEGLTLLATLPLFIFWRGHKNDFSWKRRLIPFGVLCASVFCILFLFGLFLNQKGIQIGKIQIKALKNVVNVKILENQTIKNIEKEVEETDISQIGKEFFYLAEKHRFVLYSYHIFFKTVKVFNILFLLFLFGLIKRKKIGYSQDEFLLFFIYAVFVPIFLIYLKDTNYLSTRHPFPMVVPSLIWSGVGFVELRERLILWIKGRDFPSKEQMLRWLTPLLLFVICVPLLAMAFAPHRNDKLELKETGLWLRNNGYAHSTILGQHEFARLAFYADGKFIPFLKRSYEDIIRFAREEKVNLLVINKNTIDHLSPHFLDMVSPRDLHQIDMSEVRTDKYAIMVFQVNLRERNK